VRAAVFATVYGLGFIAAAELIFWGEFRARFNFIAVDYLVYVHEASSNIYESYPVVSILLGLLALTALVYWRLAPAVERALGSHARLRMRLAPATAWLALPLLAFAGLGQDLRQFGADSYASELAGNGAYQFIAAFRNNELDYQAFYATLPQDEAAALLRRELTARDAEFLDARPYAVSRAVRAAGRERRLNVVLITVESLSADFLARFGNREGITPNLDRLTGERLFFSNFYATGTRTVRGLEAGTLSIPPTPGHAIVKRIGRESGMWSLGNVLRAKGYDVRFLYGGRGYFDNMNAFFSGNGYAVVDQSSVPEEEIHFKNAWGMADEDLYTQVLKNADDAHAQGAPFFFHVMTTSNHRPFTYPDGRIDLPSGRAGRNGAVKYTDWAIGELLAQARRRAWFEDTVFVILADQCASSAGRMALPLERYHIPMWIYSPRHRRARGRDGREPDRRRPDRARAAQHVVQLERLRPRHPGDGAGRGAGADRQPRASRLLPPRATVDAEPAAAQRRAACARERAPARRAGGDRGPGAADRDRLLPGRGQRLPAPAQRLGRAARGTAPRPQPAGNRGLDIF
jgi:phosphoglycerol transferase MdoB-like AlkP superfamily enzyme